MYSNKKMLQEICYLLSLNNGRMALPEVMKALYLVDRESMEERNFSVSQDVFCMMRFGPALSITFNILHEPPAFFDWSQYLKLVLERDDVLYPDLVLTDSAEDGKLSQKEKEYIELVSQRGVTVGEVNLPELSKVKPYSMIHYRDIMLALGKSEEEIDIAETERRDMKKLYKILYRYD